MLLLAFLLLLVQMSGAARCPTVRLNVRVTPGGTVLFVANVGEAFEAVSKTQYWYEVRRCGSSETVGWFSANDEYTEWCPCPDAGTSAPTPVPPTPAPSTLAPSTGAQTPRPTVAVGAPTDAPSTTTRSPTTTTRAPTTTSASPTSQAPARELPNFGLGYEPATSCTGKARSGMVAVRDAFMRKFEGIRDGGIYNCRNVRAGATLSEHAEGRAWDISVTVGDPVGQRVADFLYKHAAALGVQGLIYNKRVAFYGRRSTDWRPYTGASPHTDHVHVGLRRVSANGLTLDNVLALFDADQIEDIAPPVQVVDPVVEGTACTRVALNIRAGPGTSHEVQFVAYVGEIFQKIGERNGWINIRSATRLKEGWGYASGGAYLEAPCSNRRIDPAAVPPEVFDGPEIEAHVVGPVLAVLILVLLGVTAAAIYFWMKKRPSGDHADPLLAK